MPNIQVDFTAIHKILQNQQNQYLVIINFSITPQQLEQEQGAILCAQLIQNYLLEQFQQEVMIGVQVSASYYLKHLETQDRRLFTGSFFNTSAMSNVISGEQFFSFRVATWQNQFLQFCDVERASNILSNTAEANTKWAFDELKQIIFSCQMLLPAYHQFIHRNGLNNIQSRRNKRHKSFVLS